MAAEKARHPAAGLSALHEGQNVHGGTLNRVDQDQPQASQIVRAWR